MLTANVIAVDSIMDMERWREINWDDIEMGSICLNKSIKRKEEIDGKIIIIYNISARS